MYVHVCSCIYVEAIKASGKQEKKRERDDKRALISFFSSTRGVSVKLIKFSRELL